MFKNFDDFVMVDWSANNTPKSGSDSIWVACTSFDEPINYRTRHECFLGLEKILSESIKNNKRILCGFDFCFGLPKGSVGIMREAIKDKNGQENWEWLWQYLFDNIKDDEKNQSNRFEVASEMNRLLSGSNGPFWGYPKKSKKAPPDYLTVHKNKEITCKMFEEKRTTELDNKSKSVWQLLGAGSVGSQSLLGIAYLQKFRKHEEFGKHIAVYPFQKCDKSPIVFVESYYNLSFLLTGKKMEPMDKAQVDAAVKFCHKAQASGKLESLLAGTNDEDILDEGWIFTESNR